MDAARKWINTYINFKIQHIWKSNAPVQKKRKKICLVSPVEEELEETLFGIWDDVSEVCVFKSGAWGRGALGLLPVTLSLFLDFSPPPFFFQRRSWIEKRGGTGCGLLAEGELNSHSLPLSLSLSLSLLSCCIPTSCVNNSMLSVVFIAVNVFSSPNSAGIFQSCWVCVLYVVRKLGVCTFCPPWCFKRILFTLSSGELKAGKSVVTVTTETRRTLDELSTDLCHQKKRAILSVLSTCNPDM